MSDPRFLQDGFDKRLSHLIEECGEVLAAAGKTQRWGAFSVNPLLPESKQETNLVWLRRELNDLYEAMVRLDLAMRERAVKVGYEVWQKDAFGDGDVMVAGPTSLADAQHYAAVYGQDGPAWVVEVTRRFLPTDAPNPRPNPPYHGDGG